MRAAASFCALCGASIATESATTPRRGWLAPLIAGLAGGIAVGVLLTWFLFRDDGEPSTANATAEAIAERLVAQLGTEDAAVRATFLALDRGYSYPQLAITAAGGSLQPDGVVLDAHGGVIAPVAVPRDRRYARKGPPSSEMFVRTGAPHTGQPSYAAQEGDELEEDVAALNRLVSRPAPVGDQRPRRFQALQLLLELARAGYNGAEISIILARPNQILASFNGNLYVPALVGSDGRLPDQHIECPAALTKAACSEVLAGTERILGPNQVRDYFPGYDPDAVANPSQPSDTAPPDANPGPEGTVAIYTGQMDVHVCGNAAANAGTTNSIEVTVVGEVIELAFESTCYEQPWVSDGTTGATSCAYTLTVVASATGTVSESGEFSGSGTVEQSTADFHGARCKEFPYDGSNDSTEAFAISGTVSESQIAGFFHEEDSPDVPPLPFTLTRQ